MLSSLRSQTSEKPAVVNMKWGECCRWAQASYVYLTKMRLVKECCGRDLSRHFTHLGLTYLLQCRWSHQRALYRTIYLMTQVTIIHSSSTALSCKGSQGAGASWHWAKAGYKCYSAFKFLLTNNKHLCLCMRFARLFLGIKTYTLVLVTCRHPCAKHICSCPS